MNLQKEFITKEEEKELIKNINDQEWNLTLKRRTQHYGYEYSYTTTKLSKTDPIPDFLLEILKKIENLTKEKFQQVIINEYKPGQGIGAHIDHTTNFGDTIVSLSLGSQCIMNFGEEEILLPRRGLLVLTGDYRYKIKHEIKARKFDIIDGEKVERNTRISITFRKVLI